MHIDEPVWTTDIAPLFAAPYWLPEGVRTTIGFNWTRCMSSYLIDFTELSSVKEWSVTVYNHLASHNMPLTTDERQFWPPEALELFRLWVNQGWRRDKTSKFDRAERIPPAEQPATGLRVRKDIRSLTKDEVDVFRAKLDDVMKCMDPDPSSPWQQWAYIHTNWCLHYQEAFAFWHRAFLIYLEDLIDHAIPYWDWMAENASIDGSPEAGLPEAYLAETYVHPETGETRPNPLRYAAAKDGYSKMCVLESEKLNRKVTGEKCGHVNRNPLFYTSGKKDRKAREKY